MKNEKQLLQDMIAWFGDHDKANIDFMNRYGYYLNENDEYRKDINIMTLDEYNQKMNDYSEKLSQLYDDEWDELYEEMSLFQVEYMEGVLAEYKETIDCKAKECIYDLLCYAVRESQSGNAIIYVDSKEIADEIEEIIWEEIGDYLLDDLQIYEEDNSWAINCMFAGHYVPYWDGWREEY